MTQSTQAQLIEMLYAQAKSGDTQQELVCLAAIAEIERLQAYHVECQPLPISELIPWAKSLGIHMEWDSENEEIVLTNPQERNT